MKETFPGIPSGGRKDCKHQWKSAGLGFDIGVDQNGVAYTEDQKMFVCDTCGAERIDSVFTSAQQRCAVCNLVLPLNEFCSGQNTCTVCLESDD